MRFLTPTISIFAILCSAPAWAFSMHEHKELGDRGFVSAWHRLERLSKSAARKLAARPHLRRGPGLASPSELQVAALAQGKEVAWFSFGDLVSIYGDYAADVEEVNGAGMTARAALLRRMGVEGGSIASDAEKSRMMALAATNVTHFAGVAMDTYVKWHRKALELAARPARLSEALHYEALALHSYSDIFAVGHMLEERARTQKLIEWADRKGSWLVKAIKKVVKRAASSLLGLWANFYHNAFNARGARVENLDGDAWLAYGDNKYRIVAAGCAATTYLAKRGCADPSTEHQRAIIDAGVARSVLAVLKTAAGLRVEGGEALSALRKLPVRFAETRRPKAPGDQKLRILKLLAKLGKQFLSRGFDFTLGILQYESKSFAGTVSYADRVKRFAGER